jgi:hypothetical protein
MDAQPVRLAYQPPASNIFLSEQIGHQQPANSIILSEEISHQPPAKRTGSRLLLPCHARIMIHLRRRYTMIVGLAPGSLHSVMVLPLHVIRPSEAEKDSHKSCDEHRPPHTYRAARATASLPGGPPSRGRASQSQPSTPNRGGGGQGKGMISPALQASKRADEGAVVRPVPLASQPVPFSLGTHQPPPVLFFSRSNKSASATSQTHRLVG